ncbi:hypothetical protein ONA70_23725, partial [Micromonospora yasonensis]|uniref:hypothetical protein n=1 Tax=Micromonospora yasonensis TaxID=1128667 RepID=UPI0022317189
MRSYRLLATASLTTLFVALSGAVSVAAPTMDAAAATKAGRATISTAGGPRKAVRLATGERLELMSDDARSGALFRVLPAGNASSTGRYAYASVGGTLRVQPKGHPAQVVASRTGARAAAAVTADTYPVKLAIASPVSVSSKLLYVWNRQTWAYHTVTDEQYTPNGSVRLPSGDYFAVALYSQWGAGSYLLTRAFQVANAGTTVRFDESTARETRIAVDDATARRYTSAVWISVPGGGLAGFAGGGAEKVYVTPFSVPGASLRLHEILIKQGTSDYVPSPYRYDLYHSFDDAVPATPVANVAKAGLASTATSIRGQARNTNGSLLTVPATGEWTGVYLPSPVAVPGTVTEYVTPDRSFMRLLHYRPMSHDLTLADRALPAGTSAGETLGAAPFAPRRSRAAGSDRDMTRMSVYEYPALSDAAGNLGLDRDARVSVSLRSGSEPYISASGLSLYQAVSATVPAVATPYQLDHTVTRTASWSRLSTEVRSEWRFTSAGTTYPNPLPLVDIDFAVAGLDARNTARVAPVRINAAATSRRVGATPTLTGLEYSTDDGKT